MKKLLIVIGIVGLGYLAFNLFIMNTKKHSPESIARYEKEVNLQVEYCRPSKKNREIFGSLVPFGEVWRTGANEATLFKTSKDLVFGDKVLPAGQYSLFTVPGETEWQIIFNEETGQWGTQYSKDEDVLRVPAISTKIDEVKESFTIKFDDAGGKLNMLLSWDQTQVVLPILAN